MAGEQKKDEKQMVALQGEMKYQPNIEVPANIFSKITFYWTNKIIKLGEKENFDERDLFDIEEQQKLYHLINEIRQAKAQNKNMSLVKLLFYCARKDLILSTFYGMIASVLQFAGPFYLQKIIKNLSDPKGTSEDGYLLASLLFIAFFVRNFFNQHAAHIQTRISFQIINQIYGLLFDKTLALSMPARKYIEPGKMTNIIFINVIEIFIFFMWFFMIVTSPVVIGLACYFIIDELGAVGVVGPALLIVVGFITDRIQKRQTDLRRGIFSIIDERGKRINEFFSGLKIIKYYAWEDYVHQRVGEMRKREMKNLFGFNMNLGYCDVLGQIAPSIISVIQFAVYIADQKSRNDDYEFSPATAFVVLSLLNLLNTPLSTLIQGWSKYTNAIISFQRIQHLLDAEEFVGIQAQLNPTLDHSISIENAEFSWGSKVTEDHHAMDPDLAMQKAIMAKMALAQQPQPPPSQPNKQPSEKPSEIPKNKDEENSLMKKQGNQETKDSTNKQLNQKEIQIELQKLPPPSSPTKSQQPENPEKVQLKIDKLIIKKGEFVAIIGQFGSGKSSLINAMLGEMNKLKGTVSLNGKVSLISQTPWLRSCSIRNNILFGEPFEQVKYDKILEICELTPDLATFPGGDQTEIGEKGVTLSGGQKQRVAIARAIYFDSDIILVDDCLSALDSHVGKNIFKNVFKKYLKGRTVIFVTHALQYLKKFDKIAILKEGVLIEYGTYDELGSNQNGELQHLKSDFKFEEEKPLPNLELQQKESQMSNKPKEENKQEPIKQVVPEEKKAEENEKEKMKKGALFKLEDKASGSVPLKIYTFYFKMGGYDYITIALLVFFFTQGVRMFTDYWLEFWSTDKYELKDKNIYIWVYAILSVASSIFFLIRFAIFTKFSIRISLNLFKSLLDHLLKAPMWFFDVTPLGRITSRFTTDVDKVDYYISILGQYAVFGLLNILSSFIMISIKTPLFIALMVVLSILFFYLISKYLNAAREIKRVVDVKRAPLLGAFLELGNGLPIIRAFNKQKYYYQFLEKSIDQHTVANFNDHNTQRWIGIINECISSFAIGGAAYFGVIRKYEFENYDNITSKEQIIDLVKLGASIGLSLTWALQISLWLPQTMRMIADLEMSMNSVHRIYDYLYNVPVEREYNNPKPPEKWPVQGKFQFRNIRYRYREELQEVIHGISFDIDQFQKIGVIGRTGSGKSTMTLGILRIIELTKKEGEEGYIKLDDVIADQIGLFHLRRSIAIIPQDPVLFIGTVKSNVDPYGTYSNEDLISAIKQVELYEQLKIKLKKNEDEFQPIDVLDIKVELNGSNFSQGERQLICLARVLIKKPKILLMDEATASIDEKTDYLIQKTIKTKFVDTTVITIAHRLNTIIQYDKILILKDGNIEDYDTPSNMLKNKDNYLFKLVSEQGNEYLNKMNILANDKNAELNF